MRCCVAGVSGQFTDTNRLSASSWSSGRTVTPISAAASADEGCGSDPLTAMPRVAGLPVGLEADAAG